MKLTVPDEDYLYKGVRVSVYHNYLGTSLMRKSYGVTLGAFTIWHNEQDRIHTLIEQCNQAVAELWDNVS
jgi:hypothetical protein